MKKNSMFRKLSLVVFLFVIGMVSCRADFKEQISSKTVPILESPSIESTINPTTQFIYPVLQSITIDLGVTEGSYNTKLLGINRTPLLEVGDDYYNFAKLFRRFGMTSVRLHGATAANICYIYTNDRTSSSASIDSSGCLLSSSTGVDFTWEAKDTSSGATGDIANYDFNDLNHTYLALANESLHAYLRLGENKNGPNKIGISSVGAQRDAWARIAQNIVSHAYGGFGSNLGLPSVVGIEIGNEPDGTVFWRDTPSDFYELYTKTANKLSSLSFSLPDIGGAGFLANAPTNILNGDTDAVSGAAHIGTNFVSTVGTSKVEHLSFHYYTSSITGLSCGDAKLSDFTTWVDDKLHPASTLMGYSADKPIHLTEWSMGLSCGNLYDHRFRQSHVSGLLTLMQDPGSRIEQAYYFVGAPTAQALFTNTSGGSGMDIRVGAWAFWAHSNLSGNKVQTRLCTSSSCDSSWNYVKAGGAVTAITTEKKSIQSAQHWTTVISNHKSSSLTKTLHIKNVPAGMLYFQIRTPLHHYPSTTTVSTYTTTLGTLTGVISPLESSINSLISGLTKVYKQQTSIAGNVSITITVPAHGVQVIEFSETTFQQ